MSKMQKNARKRFLEHRPAGMVWAPSMAYCNGCGISPGNPPRREGLNIAVVIVGALICERWFQKSQQIVDGLCAKQGGLQQRMVFMWFPLEKPLIPWQQAIGMSILEPNVWRLEEVHAQGRIRWCHSEGHTPMLDPCYHHQKDTHFSLRVSPKWRMRQP